MIVKVIFFKAFNPEQKSEFEMNSNKIREIRLIRENPRFRLYPEYKENSDSLEETV